MFSKLTWDHQLTLSSTSHVSWVLLCGGSLVQNDNIRRTTMRVFLSLYPATAASAGSSCFLSQLACEDNNEDDGGY